MEPPDLSGSGLGLMHINAQSLMPKLGEFELMLQTVKPDIACLTETWLSGTVPDGLVNLQDYTLFRWDRGAHKRGGGLASYFHNNLLKDGSIKEHRDLWLSNMHIELQLFELKIRNIKKIILMNVYRPPSGKSEIFVDSLADSLNVIHNINEFDVFVLGDFNLPYNLVKSPSYKRFKNFESRFGLRQLITTPTRCSSHSANILDLIFTNSEHVLKADTWETSFSDHQPVYVIRKKTRVHTPRSSFRCRSFSHYVKDEFQKDLLNYDWTKFFQTLCPEKAWILLYQVILDYADKHCPFRDYVSKKELPSWLNNEILEFLKERDFKYRRAKRTSDPEDWIEVKRLRNKCTRLISMAKNNYVLGKLDEYSGDAKKFWTVINSVFSGSQVTRANIKITDPVTKSELPEEQIPDYMNNFLVQAGPKLANDLPHIPFRLTFSKFLTRLKFKRITVAETLKQIEAINIAKSSAIDGLSSCILKDALLCLPIHLAYIFNLSIDTGVFPTSWKNANVVLIPKEGARDDPNNYRPVSLLPLPGKMLEKLIHHRLFNYINEHTIFTDRQGGFRPGHGTTLTVLIS